VQKGVNRGLQQGVQQGLQQGLQESLLSMRTTLVRFVETHFPDQLSLAKQQVELMTTLSQVQETLDKLFVARTDDDVRRILLDIPHS
jgi:flagellar biosynthesis/type III secretory pathway protein FliH